MRCCRREPPQLAPPVPWLAPPTCLLCITTLPPARRQTHTQLPTVTIEYNNLTVEADALVGASSNPTVGNALRAAAKAALLQGGLRTRPVTLLDGISGVLAPVGLQGLGWCGPGGWN